MSKPKLLLIVDDWELLERYEERLADAFEVHCAPLGSEGLRIAAEEAPNVVLLNLCFENMTNDEACAALRAGGLPASTPILIAGEGEGTCADARLEGLVTAERVAEAVRGCSTRREKATC